MAFDPIAGNSARVTRRASATTGLAAAIVGCAALVGVAVPAQGVDASTPSARSMSWIARGQEQPFYASMLGALGAPVTATNLQVMEAWARSEGSRSAYNPWNTTQRAPGAKVDSNGSTSFASAATAVAAMKRQFESLYRPVIAGFGASSAERTVAAIVASPWASSHYGGAADFRRSLIWKVYVGLPKAGWRPMTFAQTTPGEVPITKARTVLRRIVLRWGETAANGARVVRFEGAIRERDDFNRAWSPWELRTVGRDRRGLMWAGLEHGHRYQVVIRAYNRLGAGHWSRRFDLVVP